MFNELKPDAGTIVAVADAIIQSSDNREIVEKIWDLCEEKLLSMTAKCKELGIQALVEVRTEDDAKKVLSVKKVYPDTIVCGVNSRNLKDFSIDLLVPAMLKEKLGGTVIFESGITLAGGASLLYGLSEAVSGVLKVPCRVADEARDCTVLGCAKVLEDPAQYRYLLNS